VSKVVRSAPAENGFSTNSTSVEYNAEEIGYVHVVPTTGGTDRDKETIWTSLQSPEDTKQNITSTIFW
jgi:hypothetical protein